MPWVDQEARTEVVTGSERPGRLDGGWLRLRDGVGPVPIRAGWCPEPLVLEWFGEGRADLLVVTEGGDLGHAATLFRQLEPTAEHPVRYDAGEPVPGLEGLRALCPVPNGAPSRFDLVALGPSGLVHLPNEGTADAPRFALRRALGHPVDLGLGAGRIAQMTADDWDGDGLIDLVIGFDSMDAYWPDDDAGVPRSQQVGFNQLGGHPGYDRQGHWRGRPASGRLFWMRNVGVPGAPRFEAPEEIVSDSGQVKVGTRPAPLAVAWGGGGAVELLLTDSTATVRLHRNFGGQRPPVLLGPRPLRDPGGLPVRLPEDRTSVVIADLDRDGRSELVHGSSDGRVFAIRGGANRDEALGPMALLTEDRVLRLGGRSVVAAADLDGDGDIDLIAGDGAGRLWLAEGVDDRRYAPPIELDASGEPFRVVPGTDGRLEGPAVPAWGFACPAIADWDGNGKLDLVVGGAGGDVIYFHHNGSLSQPRWERPITLKCEGGPLITPPRVRPAVGHWTEGDLPDLLALDLQGFIAVYPRTGPYEVGPPRPLVDRLGRVLRLDGAFGQAGGCALWAGPWTGPDRIDLLVGLSRGARHVVPGLTGQPVTTLDDVPTVLLLENLGRDQVVPRPVYLADGRPLVVGSQGCSPCGVVWSGSEGLDLLVGSDDGRVVVFGREELRW